MPWKETCAVSERHHRVKLVREGISVSEASRTLGISRKTAYEWLGRHDRWGVEGLSDRSRARHRQEHETPPSVRRLLVALRKETGAGPRQLLFLARRRPPYDRLPAVSTVSLILRREGVVKPKRRVRRTGEVKIGGRMAFISTALDGELVGLKEILHGIWRLSYR
jgi:transposase